MVLERATTFHPAQEVKTSPARDARSRDDGPRSGDDVIGQVALGHVHNWTLRTTTEAE